MELFEVIERVGLGGGILVLMAWTMRNVSQRLTKHEIQSTVEHQALLTAAGEQGEACQAHKEAMTALLAKVNGE